MVTATDGHPHRQDRGRGNGGQPLEEQHSVATVPASVTVAVDQTTATFAVTTTPVRQAGTASISASRSGQQRSASLSVVPPRVSSVALTSARITSGQASAAIVSLAGPAPSDGFAVQLSSDNTKVATVPASLTIAAGQTSARVAVTTLAVDKSSTVAVSAAAGGGTKTASLTVVPADVQVKTVSIPRELKAGRTATGTVTLDAAAPSGGVKVALKSSSASLSVPADVTVPAGSTSATFTATAPLNAAAASATVEATRVGVSAPVKATATLSVVK